MRKILLFVTLVTMSSVCYPWGQKGHDTVCKIAQNHLTKKAAKQARQLLDGKSLVYWAAWLDNGSNTPEYAYSKTWHYKNIDENETFDNAKLSEKGNIILALNAEMDTLSNKEFPRAKRQLALKMIIHLIGDLHQPLHLGHFSDLGGNQWKVNFFRNPTNLHSVWDSQIIESARKWSHTEWAKELDTYGKNFNDSVTAGSVADWGRETYSLASKVYQETPQDSNLSYDYVYKWTATVEDQLLKAGLRLAKVLNDCLK